MTGTNIDPSWLRHRIYTLTEPSLLVNAFEWEHNGVRLVIVEALEGVDVYSDTQGRATRRIATSCEVMLPDAVSRLRDERRGYDWSAQLSGRSVGDVDIQAEDAARRRLARFTDTRREMARLETSDLMRDLGVANAEGELLRAGAVMFCTPDSPPLHYQYRNTPGGEVAHGIVASPPAWSPSTRL